MLKTLFACAIIGAGFALALVIGLNRLPSAIVYTEYGTGKCIMADVVEDDEWKRITCAEFQAQGGFDEDYEVQWGSFPL